MNVLTISIAPDVLTRLLTLLSSDNESFDHLLRRVLPSVQSAPTESNSAGRTNSATLSNSGAAELTYWLLDEVHRASDATEAMADGVMKQAPHLTGHAIVRMAQRAISISDLELIRSFASEVEGGYLVREKDFQAADRELRRIRHRLRRLVCKRVALDGNRLMTAYHATRSKQRQLLRLHRRRR